jgi:hypothetical protein
VIAIKEKDNFEEIAAIKRAARTGALPMRISRPLSPERRNRSRFKAQSVANVDMI